MTSPSLKKFLATYKRLADSSAWCWSKRRAAGWRSTDSDATVAQVLEAVADRAAIEQDFHDLKEVHGAGQQPKFRSLIRRLVRLVA